MAMHHGGPGGDDVNMLWPGASRQPFGKLCSALGC